MYHFNIKHFCYKFVTLCFIAFCFLYSEDVFAMSIEDYSYKKIYDEIPDKYQNKEFIYENSAGVCLIEFADYNNNPYRTSVKRKKDTNDLLYCIDRNNSIEFTDNYVMNNELFNEELRTRLGIAFYYGPNVWKDKANSKFSTGNCIVDYYMTQIVVHSLIYEYGGKCANMGIDFDKLTFKDNTGNLKKKTTAFYQFCCDTKIEFGDGYFQAVDFQFNQLEDNNMYLDGEQFISPTITCSVRDNNADVTRFNRKLLGKFANLTTIQETTSKYNSDMQLAISLREMRKTDPGYYDVTLLEEVVFDRKQAALWQCAEWGYVDTSQELGDLYGTPHPVTDQIDLKLLVGKLHLYKTDSVTKEEITDAQFQVLQYNSTTDKYEYYCNMTYDSEKQRYESDNLYRSVNNKYGKFQVIETTPGENYKLDWNGQYFEVTPDLYIHEIYVENEPILGTLTIQKKGEQWSYKDKKFLKDTTLPLPGVKFELYAKDDIYVKDKVFFEKNKKIVDLITDNDGIAKVNSLPMGNYYIREIETLDNYIINNKITEFSITRDSKRQYNSVSLTFVNELKTSQIHIYKYCYNDNDREEKKKLPLKGAQFGVYLKNELCDIAGNVILKKDTCIGTGTTNSYGNLIFDNLPYIEYYVKELKAPDDFVLNDGIVSLKLEDFQYDERSGHYINKQEIVNKKQQFDLSIHKSGEDFIGCIPNNSEFGDYYVYEIGETDLKDVSFSLYNEKWELISTQITDKDGKAKFNGLEPGTYHLTETAAPFNYEMNEISKELVLKMDNKEYNEFTPPVIEESFFNKLCQCKIRLTKLGEHAYVKNSSLKYDQIPLDDIIYGIYQDFDYTFSGDKQPILKGSCVGYIITNQDGEGLFKGKLPCGSYYVKELQTQPGYELDPNIYSFDVQSNQNQTMEVTINGGQPFVNKLSKTAVQIIKTDSNTGKVLKGVEFTLYNANKEKIGVYKTNKKGKILVEDLPYGSYYFVETKSKNGYYSSNNKYYFGLDSEEMVTLNITNSPILKLGMNEGYKKALIITSIISIIFFSVAFVSCYFVRRSGRDE